MNMTPLSTSICIWLCAYCAYQTGVFATEDSGCSDPLCETDPLGFEAIIQLHRLIDDDHDGSLDRSESDEFFRDELKHSDGDARQARFHGSDELISVKDLWELWTSSEVYNWTVDDVIVWIEEEVDLPKYSETFRINAVDGHILPRIAVNGHYLTGILGIKNGIHKQKLSVKTTDLVLFGQNKKGRSWIKDLLLVFLLAALSFAAWYGRRQNHVSQVHMHKMMNKLEGLQKSEDAFKTLQERYEFTRRQHQETTQEKEHLEQKLVTEVSQAKNEAQRLRTTRETTEEEMSRLKLAELELVEMRKALSEAERCYEQMRMEVPPIAELQQWLQLTYEIESQHYETKKAMAEKQLRLAREMCERISRKRSGLLGTLRIAHNTSLDDTDHIIMQARGSLEEVRLHLQERSQRWQEVETTCGFDIIHNPGLHVLETTLRGVGNTYLATTLSHSASISAFSALSLDADLDEDTTPASISSRRSNADNHDQRYTLVEAAHSQSASQLRGSQVYQRHATSQSLPSGRLDGSEHDINGDSISSEEMQCESVTFGLGGESPTNELLENDESKTTYSKSKSTDETSVVGRPKELTTSRSDSAIHSIISSNSFPKRVSQISSHTTPVLEECSSHGSTESLNKTTKSTKKNPLKKLFTKSRGKKES